MKKRKLTNKPATNEFKDKQLASPLSDPKRLPITVNHVDDLQKEIAKTSTRPSINTAIVVDAFQSNIMGKGVNLSELVDDLEGKFAKVHEGDLSAMESMLVEVDPTIETDLIVV